MHDQLRTHPQKVVHGGAERAEQVLSLAEGEDGTNWRVRNAKETIYDKKVKRLFL